MDAARVIDRLVRAGVRLEARGETLRAHYGGVLSEELRGMIRQNKAELLALARRLERTTVRGLIICRDAAGTPIRPQDWVRCRDGTEAVVLQRFHHRVTVHVKGEPNARFHAPWDVMVVE